MPKSSQISTRTSAQFLVDCIELEQAPIDPRERPQRVVLTIESAEKLLPMLKSFVERKKGARARKATGTLEVREETPTVKKAPKR